MAREVFEKAGGCDGGYITEEYSVMDLWVRLGETGAPVHQEPEARLFYLPSESVLDQPGLFAPEHRERNDSWLFAYLRGVPG